MGARQVQPCHALRILLLLQCPGLRASLLIPPDPDWGFSPSAEPSPAGTTRLPVNTPLSGSAAELFEEKGDGFCVSISRPEVFIACH